MLRPLSGSGLLCPGLARKYGGQGDGARAPLPAEPPARSEDKGPLHFRLHLDIKKGWELIYAWGGNKAIWENNKYFLSIYLFFFSTFSYILLAYRFCQYVSHIYHIYLYISTMPLSRGRQRLKKPLKNGVLVNFPLWLRVLGWRSGGFPSAQMDSRPSDLHAGLHASVPRAAWLCRGNQGRRGKSKALA